MTTIEAAPVVYKLGDPIDARRGPQRKVGTVTEIGQFGGGYLHLELAGFGHVTVTESVYLRDGWDIKIIEETP
ncbi:hypothetical protein [Herbiconiux sp. YIM B11900]|uniref:hypothetical protein n=1 Tax=Herbiconiux sp. YIM B11900 TaxID=3404131 RepID=UPI003F873D56